MKSQLRHQLAILACAACWALPLPLTAQVPNLISHQGRVAVNGVNFDGNGQFKFALVNENGSTSYWSNDGTSVGGGEPATAVNLPVSKGLYSVLLGDTTLTNMQVIPNSVFSNEAVFLRVWFNDGTANGSQLLTPDQRIAAVGYAMVAGGLAPGATIPASAVSGTIPASQIATAPSGMALIPAGEFTMGDSLDEMPNATPVSTTVSAFYMDATEVTLSQWQAVRQWATLVGGYTDLYEGTGKGANHPVYALSWYACVKWCNARSEREGLTPVYYINDAQTQVYRTGNLDVTNLQVKWTANGYRLPTEAEWEKAARGGLAGKRYPWGDTISQKLANYKSDTVSFPDPYDLGPNGFNAIGASDGEPQTSPVGSFAANGYGIYDMAGNVQEWTWDRSDWHASWEEWPPYAGGIDPRGQESGALRIVRGGGWSYWALISRVATRHNMFPSEQYDVGFRAVRSWFP